MHLRIRRWVIWWFALGVICGVIALSIILGDQLTPTQERLLLALGAAHWILGGVVCWAFDAVNLGNTNPQTPPSTTASARTGAQERFSHPASDFLLPGGRRSILPWRH